MSTALSYNLNARYYGVFENVSAGDVLIGSTSGDSAGYFVKATTANRGVRRSTAVALSAYGGGKVGSVSIQQGGFVPAAITGLAAGASSWVRTSTTGRMERCTPVDGDDVIGKCNEQGDVFLDLGKWSYENVEGGTGGEEIKGFAIDGTSGVAPIIGAVPVFTQIGGASFEQKKPAGPGCYDVTSYGVCDPTGVADSSAAFAACMAAIPGTFSKGATIVIPDGIYRLDAGWDIYKCVHIRGAGMNSGSGGTQILLPARKSIHGWGFETGQAFASSTAQFSSIAGLYILKSGKATVTPWAASTGVSVGAERIIVAAANELDDRRHVYLECIKAGTTAATTPQPTAPDYSEPFVPGRTYHRGMLVRGGTGGAIDATGSNLIATAIFRCTTAGVAGGAPPTWNATLSATTTSGAAVFTAITAAEFFTADGTAVWAHRSDAGIVANCRMSLWDICIEDAGGPGVYLRGNSGSGVNTNCNGWEATNLRIRNCGIGFMCHGGDTQTGHAALLDIEGCGHDQPGNGGVGIYDASGVGNLWTACQVANDPTAGDGGGHSFLTSGAFNGATFMHCYTEAHAGSFSMHIAEHHRSSRVKVIRGSHSAGFTSRLQPAPDGTWSECSTDLGPSEGSNRGLVATAPMSPTSDQTRSGSAGTFATRNAVSGTTQITGITGVVDTDQGRAVTISGAANAANNGTFEITSADDAFPTTIYYTNRNVGASVSDANNGAISWAIGGGLVSTYLGTRDNSGAVIQWSGPSDTGANKLGLVHCSTLTGGWGLAKDWYAWTYNGIAANVMMVLPGPNATYGADNASLGGEFAPHFPGRVLFGAVADYQRSLEFAAAAPTTLRHGQGSWAFNRVWDGTSALPIAWVNSVTGTPGTWEPVYALVSTDVTTQVGTLTTTTTTAGQVIRTCDVAAATSTKRNIYRVFATFAGGGAAGSVTGSVEGSFSVDSAGAITRLGTDSASTTKGTGITAAVFALSISGTSLRAVVTPSSATSTNWKVTVQVEKLLGVNA